MKNYFSFEFFGWINKLSKSTTRNGINFIRIQVVNGSDYIFMHCFEDFDCFYDDIQIGDWVKINGNISQNENSYFFKPKTIKIINKRSAKDSKPSSDKDIKEVIKNE